MLRFPVVRVVAVFAVAACCMTPALSAEGEKKAPDLDKAFVRKDANKDGFLSLEEYKKGVKEPALPKAEKQFKKMDTDGNDKVSLEEFKTGFPKKKA